MTAPNRLPDRTRGLVLSAMLVLGAIPYASAGETITFFHNDVAGSPLLATDVNGLIAWKETYRPYGDRVLESPASTNNNLWFTGKSHDTTTGLTYMGARYYDPTIGRFMGIDPASIDLDNLHGINRFTYANNNPYKFVDPDGRLPIFLIPLIIKAIDIALTAHDVYTAAEEGGAAGVAKVAAENAALSAVPGGKIGSKIINGVRKADVPNNSSQRLGDLDAFASQRGGPRNKPGSQGQFKGRDALRRENRMAHDAATRAGLNREQRRILHDEISGQGIDDFQELLRIARDIKAGR